ncbi:MAG: hypothetical protein RI955_2027 [Bacteroidota bacterium]
MNIIAYIIYLIITFFITVNVGLILYKNGRIYILETLNHNEELTDTVNKILLMGYYLTNLGYAAIMINFWQHIETYTQLVESVSTMVGRIVLGLALLHYFNMYIINKFKHKIIIS